MCYRETKNVAYLRQAENVAKFILHHPNLPADKIPYWDFNAPDGVPGFGTFKSDEEIKALAQRLFGPDSAEEQPLPQPPPHDTAGAPSPEVSVQRDESLDKDHSTYALVEESRPQNKNTTAVQHDEDAATQRVTARRHGGASAAGRRCRHLPHRPRRRRSARWIWWRWMAVRT